MRVVSHIPKPLVAAILIMSVACFSQETGATDFLSVKLSKKNQLRTSMFWIQHKSRLLLGASLLKASKPNRREQRRIFDAGRSATILSEEDIGKDKPFSAVGKLFFTGNEGEIRSCTASFTSDSNVILTAAHCVMTEAGDWHEDFLFVRSFGTGKQEIYAVSCVAVTSMWGEYGSDEASLFDYAALKTSRMHDGAMLNISKEQPPSKLQIVGYSDNHKGGMSLLKLDIQTFFQENKIGSRKNPFGSGNSGAPWIAGDQVYSISSYYMADEKGIVWGPQMSEQVSGLLKYASTRCG